MSSESHWLDFCERVSTLSAHENEGENLDVALIGLIDQATNPMWIFDQETLRFMAVNRAALKVYGYRRDEFLTLTVLDIRPAGEVPKFLNSAVRTHHSSLAPERWTHLTKANRQITVSINSLETVFQGRKVEVVCSIPILDEREIVAGCNLNADPNHSSAQVK